VIRGPALFAFTVALATLSASAVRLSQARALVPVTGGGHCRAGDACGIAGANASASR
jgi:hypothetical protein